MFLPQAERDGVFEKMKALAASLSDRHCCFQLLIPIDNELVLSVGESVSTKRANALKIRLANEAMIETCDAVIANLSPFRGAEPDSGTAYECGFARALGKSVLVYTDNQVEQTGKYAGFDFGRSAPDGRYAYTEIEDFALPFNLMMYDESMPIFDSFDQAFRYYAQKCLSEKV